MKAFTKETYLCVGEGTPYPYPRTIHRLFGISLTQWYFIIIIPLLVVVSVLVVI